jgi:hypothetical protein
MIHQDMLAPAILDNKHRSLPSVFVPAALLRAAPHQPSRFNDGRMGLNGINLPTDVTLEVHPSRMSHDSTFGG